MLADDRTVPRFRSGSDPLVAHGGATLRTVTQAITGRWRTIAWALLLATAFVATHVPPPEQPYPRMPNDKLLHAIGFTALGVATIWRPAARRTKITAKMALAWWLFLAAYGLLDETTQPIVRRTFEWSDWLADCCGAALGVVGAACWYRVRPRPDGEG